MFSSHLPVLMIPDEPDAVFRAIEGDEVGLLITYRLLPHRAISPITEEVFNGSVRSEFFGWNANASITEIRAHTTSNSKRVKADSLHPVLVGRITAAILSGDGLTGTGYSNSQLLMSALSSSPPASPSMPKELRS
jgi:hypothetical protein